MPDFTLYSHVGGPNGWKVAIILEELGLSYETKFLQFGDGPDGVKNETFLKVNPNGRIPAIVDHKNNNFELWESGAIIEYLVDKYDTQGKLKPTGDDKYKVAQWVDFQVSGQGPYFGQTAWFKLYHSEKIPSAIERYEKEIRRVLGVLERHFKQTNQEYLVASHITYADLAFVPWNQLATDFLLTDLKIEKEFPLTAKWHKSLLERPAVKKIFDDKKAASAKKE